MPRAEKSKIWQNDNPFHLMFITSNQKCIACKRAFNKGNNAPFNLCLLHKERYDYLFKGDFHDIWESVGEKNFYYHLDMSCVCGRHPLFQPGEISITESVRENLKDSHLCLLKDVMGVLSLGESCHDWKGHAFTKISIQRTHIVKWHCCC